MPEGDTVWRSCRRLHQALAGQLLTRTDLRVPSLAVADLSGHTVEEVVARGKHILMRLSGGLTLHSHFRMDGSWHLYRPGERWRGGPQHQVRAVLETADWIAVGYRLPVLDVIRTAEEAGTVGHLGPDLLDPGFDRETALANLAAEPDRSISEALLDQRNLAGIGNLYRVEVCFLTGIHPEQPAGTVDLGRVVDLSRRLMRSNLERVAQVTTGVDRPGQRTWVYDRGGKACRRCGARIETGSSGRPPYDRVSYWCPSCQPGR